MVIAIIGILASIVLVNLSGAMTKAKSAAMVSSAESIMQAALIGATSTNDYSAYNLNAWIPTSKSCSSLPSAVQSACNSMVADYPNYPYVMLIGTGGLNNPNKDLDITVWLPDSTMYCINSSGITYKGPGNYPGKGTYYAPGCWYNIM